VTPRVVLVDGDNAIVRWLAEAAAKTVEQA
jgi:hypothetical protein